MSEGKLNAGFHGRTPSLNDGDQPAVNEGNSHDESHGKVQHSSHDEQDSTKQGHFHSLGASGDRVSGGEEQTDSSVASGDSGVKSNIPNGNNKNDVSVGATASAHWAPYGGDVELRNGQVNRESSSETGQHGKTKLLSGCASGRQSPTTTLQNGVTPRPDHIELVIDKGTFSAAPDGIASGCAESSSQSLSYGIPLFIS